MRRFAPIAALRAECQRHHLAAGRHVALDPPRDPGASDAGRLRLPILARLGDVDDALTAELFDHELGLGPADIQRCDQLSHQATLVSLWKKTNASGTMPLMRAGSTARLCITSASSMGRCTADTSGMRTMDRCCCSAASSVVTKITLCPACARVSAPPSSRSPPASTCPVRPADSISPWRYCRVEKPVAGTRAFLRSSSEPTSAEPTEGAAAA